MPVSYAMRKFGEASCRSTRCRCVAALDPVVVLLLPPPPQAAAISASADGERGGCDQPLPPMPTVQSPYLPGSIRCRGSADCPPPRAVHSYMTSYDASELGDRALRAGQLARRRARSSAGSASSTTPSHSVAPRRVEDAAVAEPERDVVGAVRVAVGDEVARRGARLGDGSPASSCWSASRGTSRPVARKLMWTRPEQSMPAAVIPPQR